MEKSRPFILSLVLAAVFITGCGLVFPVNNKLVEKEELSILSSNDSIVYEITDILREEKNLEVSRRQEIERRINSFPGRVVRRDTDTYFLQTILGIAYNEFVTGDLDKTKSIADEFVSNVLKHDWKENVFSYFVIRSTGSAMETKKKYKDETPNLENSLNLQKLPLFEFTRDNLSFMADVFEGLPTDLNFSTYKYLLREFKELGGSPGMLIHLLTPGFYHKCKVAGREDVLEEIREIWNLNNEDFHFNENNQFTYFNHSPRLTEWSSFNEENLKEFSLSLYDDDGNLHVIDSLITINKQDSIGKYVENYQKLKYQRGKNRDLIEMSEKYETYIPENWKHRFYNYWGMAHMALGENEDAANKYSRASKYRTDKEIFSGAVINNALALAELGKYAEALKLYKSQENKPANLSDSIAYWEGMAYIHSLFNKEKALEYYNKVDELLDNAPSRSVNLEYSFLTRHFAREARLKDSDLFEWRETLRKARYYSGEDSYVNFNGTIHNSLYHSEMGRYRNFLFDFEGAAKDFEEAQRKVEKLDSNDYRVKWWNESWKDLHNFNASYGKDRNSIIASMNYEELSPLHKIWLIGNLVTNITADSIPNNDSGPSDFVNDLASGFIVDNLQSNLGEALVALSSDESKFMTVPVLKIQNLLMRKDIIRENPYELARLNLLRKGLLQTSKVAIEKELMTGERREDYEELKSLRKKLNHAYIYEDSLGIRKLLPLISSKERKLYYSLRDSINIANVISANPEDICINLKEKDLAIDFIEYSKNDSTITGAFIYFPNEDIRYIELSTFKDKGGGNLWKNLLPLLENREDIYFSPDGSLVNKGIEFYKDENGEPIFQNHRLHRVSHLRNIEMKNSSITGEIAVIGISDHNSPIGESQNLYRGEWTDLPDVEYEVRLIDTVLYQYPHQLYFNDDAIEENIKALDGKEVSVIHFSTHGVYRNTDSLVNAASDKNHFDHNIALRTLKTENRNICGIILRKGNITWKMPHLLDDEDDVLTAEEIEVMNFPNLQLTVLSACDSGLGDINSDGVKGLQRAFKIAGSKNIICSLNKVDDYWSAQFMGELYRNLAAGHSIYDSFRKAQENLRIAAPENPVAWSSYILIE